MRFDVLGLTTAAVLFGHGAHAEQSEAPVTADATEASASPDEYADGFARGQAAAKEVRPFGWMAGGAGATCAGLAMGLVNPADGVVGASVGCLGFTGIGLASEVGEPPMWTEVQSDQWLQGYEDGYSKKLRRRRAAFAFGGGAIAGGSVVVVGGAAVLIILSSAGVDGRPYRHLGRPVVGRLVALPGATRPPPLPAPQRLAAARSWLERARDEQTAVPAFLQIADELHALGAPTHLVRRALRSARQEVTHTRLCLDIAGALVGRRLAAMPVPFARRDLRDRGEALARLAVDAWTDGVLGEGEAAARAGLAADDTTWAPARRANRQIAVEEAEHAALSRDMLAWCTREGGAPVRRAVAAAVEQSTRPVPAEPHAHTWPTLGIASRQARSRARALSRATA